MEEYQVQIMDNMLVTASRAFKNLSDATESAKRIVNYLHESENKDTSYAMIWQGKTLVNYIS